MRNNAMLFCMMNTSPNWDHYKTFFLVLQKGSLSAAAKMLGVKQSTVGRQIESLEKDLGVTLFTRSPKGLRPTDAAIRLKPHLEILASASEALVRDVQADDNAVSGTIRITTSETVGFDILPRVLGEIQLKFPLIKFEISITDNYQDLLSREADIAIRSGPLDQKAILAKKVGDLEMGLFGSKEYMRGKKHPRTDEDLKDYALIGLEQNSERMRRASKLAPLLGRTDFTYLSNNMLMHSRLVDAGCGLGLCWADKARTDRVRILPEVHGAIYTLWVAMHEDLKKNRKYRAVFSELAVSLKAHLA
jgi:DNA-binding transcriptional LysR family regulator